MLLEGPPEDGQTSQLGARLTDVGGVALDDTPGKPLTVPPPLLPAALAAAAPPPADPPPPARVVADDGAEADGLDPAPTALPVALPAALPFAAAPGKLVI